MNNISCIVNNISKVKAIADLKLSLRILLLPCEHNVQLW